MLEAVGHRVVALHRSRFGMLTDAGLALGQARPLSPPEVEIEDLRPRRRSPADRCVARVTGGARAAEPGACSILAVRASTGCAGND